MAIFSPVTDSFWAAAISLTSRSISRFFSFVGSTSMSVPSLVTVTVYRP